MQKTVGFASLHPPYSFVTAQVETFQERLNWLHPDHYEYSNSRVIIRETLQGGEAEVTCYVSNNALRINLGERNRLHYLKKGEFIPLTLNL